MKIVRNGGQETRQTCALTLLEGRLLWEEGLDEAFTKAVGVGQGHYLAEQKRSSSVFEAKAKKNDQVKTTQQKDAASSLSVAWPRDKNGFPRELLHSVWNMSCSMLMSHIVLFPGVDAREGTVVTCSLFIKTVYLVESLCLTFVPNNC